MASSAPAQATPTRVRSKGGRYNKDKESTIGNGQQSTVRLKVVVRHLPSLLKESEFRDVMSNYINDDTCDFFSWNQGKIPEDRNKTPTPSRCYIKLKDPMHVTALNNAVRAHGIFTDSKGNPSLPQMEFSPFQKAPKKVQRIDTRAGTIESDPDFQAFLALLNPTAAPAGTDGWAEAAIPPTLDANAPAPIPANDPLSVPLPTNELYEKPKTTPLIEFIRGQKASPGDKAKSKATEKSPSDSGRPKRDRRAREKFKLKGKEKEKHDGPRAIEPMALLKRADSGPSRLARQGSSGTAALLSVPPSAPRGPSNHAVQKLDEKGATPEPEIVEKSRRRERERRRGGISGVAAILQRDLGIGAAAGGRRARGRAAPPSEPATPTTVSPAAPSITTPTTPSFGPSVTGSEPTTPKTPQQPPDSPSRVQQKPRDRPSRRERRAAKLEREESNASNASAGAPSAPIAIFRSQSSGLAAGGPAAMLVKRQSTLGETSSGTPGGNASPSAPVLPPLNTSIPQGPVSTTPTTPTGPRGGRHKGPRGGPRGGTITEGSAAPVQPQTPASPTPPTGPAAGVHGPFGRGGHRGGHRSGRGQQFGGRGGRGGGSRVGMAGSPAGGAQSAGAPPAAA